MRELYELCVWCHWQESLSVSVWVSHVGLYAPSTDSHKYLCNRIVCFRLTFNITNHFIPDFNWRPRHLSCFDALLKIYMPIGHCSLAAPLPVLLFSSPPASLLSLVKSARPRLVNSKEIEKCGVTNKNALKECLHWMCSCFVVTWHSKCKTTTEILLVI